ncbi:MAG TPA: 2OG-Fe(II) oxygenase [Caulobacteraceae bacterium]
MTVGGAPPIPDGPFVGRNFLPPLALARILDALDRLSASWNASDALGLLGRGQTGQIRATSLAAQTQLDRIRLEIAPAALQWAKTCGFWFPTAPQLQLFPVRMVGDASEPAFQEPHTDSHAGQPGPPICTNVFYARARGVVGGDLALAPRVGPGDAEPIVVKPSPNTIVSFRGDRVHWVLPLLAGERLSLVINFY